MKTKEKKYYIRATMPDGSPWIPPKSKEQRHKEYVRRKQRKV